MAAKKNPSGTVFVHPDYDHELTLSDPGDKVTARDRGWREKSEKPTPVASNLPTETKTKAKAEADK